jgi:hypothetical protein
MRDQIIVIAMSMNRCPTIPTLTLPLCRPQQFSHARLDMAQGTKCRALQFGATSPALRRRMPPFTRARAVKGDGGSSDWPREREALARQNVDSGTVFFGTLEEMRAHWRKEQIVHEAVLRALGLPVAGRRPGNTG